MVQDGWTNPRWTAFGFPKGSESVQVQQDWVHFPMAGEGSMAFGQSACMWDEQLWQRHSAHEFGNLVMSKETLSTSAVQRSGLWLMQSLGIAYN